MRIASIDIGSNTILMQILNKNLAGKVKIIDDKHDIACLGKGMKASGGINKFVINEETIVKAERILFKYAKICDEYSVDDVVAVGTSVLREATNSIEVVKRLEKILKHPIKVIDGKQEALFSFIGAIRGGIRNKNYTVIDIGGGSTEIISGKLYNSMQKIDNSVWKIDNGSDDIYDMYSHICDINCSISIPIGVVKLTEDENFRRICSHLRSITQNNKNTHLRTNAMLSHFKTMNSHIRTIRSDIKKAFKMVDVNQFKGKVTATSGTSSAMAAIALGVTESASKQINNHLFTNADLHSISSLIQLKSIKNLIMDHNIERGRAEVLHAGAFLLCEILDILGKDGIRVSTNGLRYGVGIDYFIRNEMQRVTKGY